MERLFSLKSPLLLLGFLVFSACNDNSNETQEISSLASITITEAEPRVLSDHFTVSSEIVAYKRVYVASRIPGLIEEVNFEEGQFVNRGEVMAKLDVRQQQIDLKRANTSLEEARDTYNRIEQLYERESVAEAEYLSAKRALEQAESEIESLELLVEYGEISAPINGVVTARLVEQGNNVSENERMFTLADMDLLVIRPGVSELNLTGIEVGQMVDITIDVYPDRHFRGVVRRIFPGVDALTRLFTVEIELIQDDEQPVIRIGYLARVRFSPEESRESLSVPSEAVINQNGSNYLYVLNDNDDKVTLTPVESGVHRNGFTEIISGIEEGAKVAATNLEALQDGSAVRVVGTFRRYGFRN